MVSVEVVLLAWASFCELCDLLPFCSGCFSPPFGEVSLSVVHDPAAALNFGDNNV